MPSPAGRARSWSPSRRTAAAPSAAARPGPDAAARPTPVRERREAPALVHPPRGRPPDPQPQRGDHAERALGAQDELPQVGPGRRLRRAAQVRGSPAGVATVSPDHHVVEPAVPRRGLAAGPGRGEPAERGVLERLREVAQGQPVPVEQPLGLGRAQPGLDGRRSSTRRRPRRAGPAGPGPARPPRRSRAGRRPGRRRRRCRRRTAPPRPGAAAQSRSSASTSSCEPGSTTASGASEPSPARMRSRSGVDLPRVCRMRASSSKSHVVVAHDAAQLGQDGRRERDRGQPYLAEGRGRALPAARTPSRSWSSLRSGSGSRGLGGVAPAGPEHGFGGALGVSTSTL